MEPKIINNITFVATEEREERDIIFSATLECKKSLKTNRGADFAVLSAKGKYLLGQLDNEEDLDVEAYYDLRFVRSSGIVLPVNPELDGIYVIEFKGRAWIDTREDEEEDGEPSLKRRPKVFLKGHDVKFTKKANLIKR